MYTHSVDSRCHALCCFFFKILIDFLNFNNSFVQLFYIFVQIFSAHTRQVVASHQIEIINTYPQEGWVEQDPKEILTAVKQCIKNAVEILQADGVEPSDIVAVGITNQRETTVVWDAVTGEPLHNAIGNKIYYC